MSRLIVISNRVNLPQKSAGGGIGGLAVAILDTLKRNGGVWFGWSGNIADDGESDVTIQENKGIIYATIDLTQQDYEEYYNGFANRSLWPLMHYRTDITEYSKKNRTGYQRVNNLFARKLLPLLKEDDILWVHDYHLILLASELRALGWKHRIGFFLHIPWPAREVLLALPGHADLVKSLMDYDIIGFQTKSYVFTLMDYIIREARGAADSSGAVHAYRQHVKVRHFPISIDTEDFTKFAAASKDSAQVRRLKEILRDRKLILGVDRLDYSKGLMQRFHAYEKLLQNYSRRRIRPTFMQIAPPSREDVPEYQHIRSELESEAGRINSHYSDFDWTPIRYLNKGYSRKILSGFYRMSHVGLVTPFRDGMNLVAKEYVAAQDEADPGVLVLSRFAGAAEELDGALLVNPYDWEGMAEALEKALTMPLKERQVRWRQMMDQIQEFDVFRWANDCVKAIREA